MREIPKNGTIRLFRQILSYAQELRQPDYFLIQEQTLKMGCYRNHSSNMNFWESID